MGGRTNTTSPRTKGGLQRGAIATMTTGRRATATVTSIKWRFLETGRTVGGVRTGAGGLRGGAIGRSTTEAGRPPDTGAETEAGEQSGRPESEQQGRLLLSRVFVLRERYRHRDGRRSQSPDRHRKRPRRFVSFSQCNLLLGCWQAPLLGGQGRS